MDNQIVDICPYCKSEGTVTNWFDEQIEEVIVEDEEEV